MSGPTVKKVIGMLVAMDPMYSISTTGKLETWFWGFVPPSTDCTVKSNVAGISGRNVCQKRHASECSAINPATLAVFEGCVAGVVGIL